MRLAAEVDEATFERIASGDLSALHGRVSSIEVSQQDGLLACERRVVLVEGTSRIVAEKHGVGDGAGPSMRVCFGPEKEG